MTTTKFKLRYKDEALDELIKKADHKTLATWAVNCVERVMPHFEEMYPHDKRPREAINTLKAWIITGIFKAEIFKENSLSSLAAAREVGEHKAACSVACAAGQAVAIAHDRSHASEVAMYTVEAILRVSQPLHAEIAAKKEREWQMQNLRRLSSIKL